MGMFSWYTQDTNRRIINGENRHIVMTDNKGNRYSEECYEGYGEFGGKDYYELMAEMNDYTIEQFDGSHDLLRNKGISLAFDGDNSGENAPHIYPSLTENGVYYNGKSPHIDPNQGFSDF